MVCAFVKDDGSGMAVEDVAWCSIHNWFPIYAKNSIKTKIVPLPRDVVEYLKADTIVLPGAAPEDSDDDSSWSDDGEASESVSFPETEAAIEEAISALGGAVFPKLNWSSPKVNNASLFLLLPPPATHPPKHPHSPTSSHRCAVLLSPYRTLHGSPYARRSNARP